jgi:hypothetical protein
VRHGRYTTALVCAGLLLSAGAEAQETEVGGLEVVLGGSTEFGINAASRDTLVDVPNRNYTFFMDNLIFLNADGATESGILYGSKIELEVGSGDGTIVDPEVDEVGLYVSGDFGRIELGQLRSERPVELSLPGRLFMVSRLRGRR